MRCLATCGQRISPRIGIELRARAIQTFRGVMLPLFAVLPLLAGGCEEHSLPSASSENVSSGNVQSGNVTSSSTTLSNKSGPPPGDLTSSSRTPATASPPTAGKTPDTKGNPGAGSAVPAPAASKTIPPGTVVVRPHPKGEMQDISFDTIKLDLVPGQKYETKLLTDGVRGLDKQKIRIRGYINPQFVFSEEVTFFILARDNQTCCFGPNAMLCDFMLVQMAPGKSAKFTTSPVTVEGEFSIQEQLDPDGNHAAIYSLVGESVR